jgi:DNA-binding IclR family transcriptional regulator
MATIKFITASGGLATTERVLQVINQYPEGCSIKQLSQMLNRPVSMINLCIKTLVTNKQVKVQLSDDQMQRLVFPRFNQLDKRSNLIRLLSRL